MPKTTVLQPNQTQFFSSKRLFISKIIVPITSTAVAVMFTFSFGSAFAATDYNKSLAGEYFNVAMSVVKDAGTVTLDGYAVDYATLEANRADLLAAANDWAKAFDTTSGNAQAYIDGQADRTIADLLADADNADLKLAIVAAQYATD